MRFDSERILAASRAARDLLGPSVCEGASSAALADRLAADAPDVSPAMRRLIERGAPFRDRIVIDGAAHEVEGATLGAFCTLSLRDIDRETRALAEAEAARDRAEAEAAALRAAIDAARLPMRRVDAAGRPLWSSLAAETAPPQSGRIAAPDGGAVEFPLFESEGEAADRGAMRRFVGPIAETFAHLRVGLAIFDSRKRLILSNPAAARMFNAEPNWLAGRPTLREILDRLRDARLLPEQSDYPAWRATITALFETPGDAAYDEIWELPDGRGIHVIARPHPMGGIAFVFEDYTESISLQRWRSTAVEVRRATLDMLGDGVAVFGSDGRMRMCNPAFRSIWSLPDAEGPAHVADLARSCGPRCEPADAELWSRLHSAVSSDGARAPWRARARLRDGRVIAARVAQMPDGSVLAAFSDVTDSERVAEALRARAGALEEAEEMRRALVDQLSHRLRTPLNALVGFAQLLLAERGGALNDAQKRYVLHLDAAASALRDGIESLSDLAWLQAGDVELEPRRAPLGPALEQAVEFLSKRAAARGARVEIEPEAKRVEATADAARLAQLLYNLLDDGLSASVEGDVVTLGARATAEGAEIWCDRPGASDGAALALALARRVAELHGGGLTVSRREDGARVLCAIPHPPAGAVARSAATG